MTPTELKRIRRQLGLTQKQLAERLGVIPVSVARWELGLRGISEPVARLLKRFAAGRLKKGEHDVGPLMRREDGVYVEPIPGEDPDYHWLWVTVSPEWPIPPRATRYLVRYPRDEEGARGKTVICRISPKGVIKSLTTDRAKVIWPTLMSAVLEALAPK